jgi:signal transduction histidine kinase
MQSRLIQRLKKPMPLGGQLLVAVFTAAAGPMLLLIAVGGAFFYENRIGGFSFRHWTFLVVIGALGLSFLLARLLTDRLLTQLDEIAANAGKGSASAGGSFGSDGEVAGEFAALEDRFSRIEAVVAAERSASLERIHDLESDLSTLERSARERLRFFSTVSHELRTPVSAMVSAARIIQRHHASQPEVVARFGDSIVNEGNRLVRSISDLLDLLKIESDTLDWNPGELHIAGVIHDAARRCEVEAHQRGLEWSVHVPEGLPTVRADGQRIGQALEKLLSNAVKFTPSGGRVTLDARVTGGGELRIGVKDTGVGICPAELSKILGRHADPGHGSLEIGGEHGSHGVGPGLGLALVQRIATRHDGRLEVSSVPGSGSEFSLVLPVAGLVDEPQPGPGSREEEHSAPRVALVMQNSLLAECAVRALRLQDVESMVCTSVRELDGLCELEAPEIVVLSSAFAWNVTEAFEQRLRFAGVRHLLLHSIREGLIEVSPRTDTEPVRKALEAAIGGSGRILLIEADEEYSAVMEFELGEAGYSVTRSFNGVEGVEMALHDRPDAMILDLAAPGLDGYRILARLEESGVEIPTVVLTALDDTSLDARLAEMGVLKTFRKFELIEERDRDVLAMIRKVLQPVLAVSASDPADDDTAHEPISA